MYQKRMNTNTMKGISLPSENGVSSGFLVEYMAYLGNKNNLNSS